MAIGDTITRQAFVDLFVANITGTYVWHETNRPSVTLPADGGNLSPGDSSGTTVSLSATYTGSTFGGTTPNIPAGTITASTIKSAMLAAGKAYTNIRTLRWRVYYNNGGSNQLITDQTQKTLMDTSYQVDLTQTFGNALDTIKWNDLVTYINGMKTAITNIHNTSVVVDNSYCHSSCVSGNTLLKVLHNGTKQKILIKDLEGKDLTQFKVHSPEGYIPIVKLYNNGVKDLFRINDTIAITLDHKFITDLELNSKQEVRKLIGDYILSKSGKYRINKLEYWGTQTVYDIEVDSKEHRYYATDKDYLISNCHSSCHGSRSRR